MVYQHKLICIDCQVHTFHLHEFISHCLSAVFEVLLGLRRRMTILFLDTQGCVGLSSLTTSSGLFSLTSLAAVSPSPCPIAELRCVTTVAATCHGCG